MKDQFMISMGPMLNAYPDSMGGSLGEIVTLLRRPEFTRAFDSFYILPSIFNTDLDRGFSIIDYELNKSFACREDLNALRELGIALKFDLILNHASVLSPQFQDLLKNGEHSRYKDFFINWNDFWAGHGVMTPDGYIQPDAQLLEPMFFRKPGLPILMVRMPDGKEIPYWNTFYQEVRYPPVNELELVRCLGIQYLTARHISALVNDGLRHGETPASLDFGPLDEYRDMVVEYLESRRLYLGQMDLNIQSPLVWEFYEDTLHRLADYGAQIIRLDAFAYACKQPGARNFMNEPETWEILERVRAIAGRYGLCLLPEIHTSYEEKTHEAICASGCMTYDFFLSGLLLDAFEHQSFAYLVHWIDDILSKGLRVVNMLGCHDGIPLLDLKGLLPESRIQNMVKLLQRRGGLVKNLHGAKNMYYQVNCTYYSALGESPQKLLLARAIQLFMPGKPQVWYLDLFAGKNDYAAVQRVAEGGHKEINRTNLTSAQTAELLENDVVRQQLALCQFRNTFPAFAWESDISADSSAPHLLSLTWRHQGYTACLTADLTTFSFRIETAAPDGIKNIIYEDLTHDL